MPSASGDGNIKLWEPASGQLVKTLSREESPVTGITFSPVNNLLVSGYDEGIIQIWEPGSSKPLKKSFKGHSDSIKGIAFSPNGNFFASASDDTTVRVWHQDGTLDKVLYGHNEPVWDVAFSHR